MNKDDCDSSLIIIIIVYLDLKQNYCRDLRDCQTYFPCAVFSSGFSYLYVIKRCPNGQIFDEKKQKCIKNTFEDSTCAKSTSQNKSRPSTIRPARVKPTKRKNLTAQQPRKKLPVNPSVNLFKRKNFDVEQRADFDQQEQEDETFQIPTSTIPTRIEEDDSVPTKMHRVCYVTNWSRYRSGEAKFEIEYIDPFMCTHIIYAYATVDDNKPEIIPIQKEDIGK